MSKTIETIEEKLISIKFNIRVLPEKYNSKMKADNGVFTMFFIHSASNYDTYSHSFKFNLIQNWLLSVTASKSDYLHHIDDIEDLKYLLSKSSSFSIFWGKKDSINYNNFIQLDRNKNVIHAYTNNTKVLLVLQFLSSKKYMLNRDFNFLHARDSMKRLKSKLNVGWEIDQERDYVFLIKQFKDSESRFFVTKVSNGKKIESIKQNQDKVINSQVLLNYASFLEFRKENPQVKEFYFLTVNNKHMNVVPFIIDNLLDLKFNTPLVLINLKEKENLKGIYELIKDMEESLMIIDYSNGDYPTKFKLSFNPYSENTRIRIKQFISKKDKNKLTPFVKSSQKKERHLEAIEINRELYNQLKDQSGSSFFVIYYYKENEYLDALIRSFKDKLQSSVIYNIYKMNLFENDIEESIEYSIYPRIRFFNEFKPYNQVITYNEIGMDWFKSIKTPFFSAEL